jgi:hypothetical protein
VATVPVVDPPDELSVANIDDGYPADLVTEILRRVGEEHHRALSVAEDFGLIRTCPGWPLRHVLAEQRLQRIPGRELPAEGRIDVRRIGPVEERHGPIRAVSALCG